MDSLSRSACRPSSFVRCKKGRSSLLSARRAACGLLFQFVKQAGKAALRPVSAWFPMRLVQFHEFGDLVFALALAAQFRNTLLHCRESLYPLLQIGALHDRSVSWNDCIEVEFQG